MALSDPVANVCGKCVTEHDVVARLKITGLFGQAAVQLARDTALLHTADELDIHVSDQELQEAYDDFRRANNLHKAADTEAWLKQLGLAIEEVEGYLEADLLHEKVAARLVTAEQVEKYYAEHPDEFEFARVSQIVIADKNAAEELLLSLREEGEEFAALARQHSIDKQSAPGGGYRGLVTRGDTGDLPGDVADRIFSADAGSVAGPFEVGGGWCLVRIEESGRLPLDDSLKHDITLTLADRMLSEKHGIG